VAITHTIGGAVLVMTNGNRDDGMPSLVDTDQLVPIPLASRRGRGPVGGRGPPRSGRQGDGGSAKNGQFENWLPTLDTFRTFAA
jgi:hypothetical protein